VLRQGYRLGERLLRPAMVGVTDPSSEPPEAAAETEEQELSDENQSNNETDESES
jgi:hypothetical protein